MNNTRGMGRKKLDRERFNITLPKGMGEELADAAKERGWDRSRLIEDLAEPFLKKWRKERQQADPK